MITICNVYGGQSSLVNNGDGDGKETFNVPDWRSLAQRRCLPPDMKVANIKLYITYHTHTE